MSKNQSPITYQIKAELWLCEEWNKDTEIIVTSDVGPTLGGAKKMIEALYPHYSVRNVEIGPIE